MSERVHLDDFEAVADPAPNVADSRTRTPKPPTAKGSVRPAPEPDAGGQSKRPPPLALEPDILSRFRADLARAGVAGEEALGQLVYLALTSRLLPWGNPTERPVSLIVKGTSSSGKSFTVTTTRRFFPDAAFYLLGSMSRRFLFYDVEPLDHRFLIVAEWASIAEDTELVALLRVLLSEGRIVHGTVDVDGRSRTARRLERDGPTGLIVTTTMAAVDTEMETRCLSLLTDDSREQTRRVFASLASFETQSAPVDLEPWHSLQSWLATQPTTHVVVPFIRALAQTMPDTATRLRRDFPTLLSLIRTHAILHRAQREHDDQGRLIATLDGDYAPVCALVSSVIAETVDAHVSAATCETVEAVRQIIAEGVDHATPNAITARLEIGRSAVYDRIKRGLASGHLTNLAGRNERAMKLALGTPLPGEADFLPTVETIVQAMSDTDSGRAKLEAIRRAVSVSGIPAVPAGQDHEPAVTREPFTGNHDPHRGGSQWWLARDGRRRRLDLEPPAFPGEVVAIEPAAEGA